MTIASIGTVLDGKYQIVEALASGGMGDVFLARHLHLDELRVIKVLRQDLTSDDASQKRFLREARLATQIKHPNVAILHDCSRLGEGSFYMVWEHVKGQDVGIHLAEKGLFAVDMVVDLGIQALRGLEAIHSIGVIHRDLSPDNLMIFTNPRGRLQVKIIDLGLARTLAPDPNYEVTEVGTFTGKLRYCSPEQARMAEGEDLDRRTDIYSLALVLYEMVSGLLPFEGRGPASVLARVTGEPLPLSGRNPDVDVPPALNDVIMKALRRERDDRYANAVSFIEALDDLGRSLTEASTREVPALEGGPGRGAAGRSRSSELSRAERDSLLAQIDRAAQRVKEGSQVIDQAQAALDEGKLTEARALVDRLEETTPGNRSLADLRLRLQEAEVEDAHLQRVRELEAMLTRYMQKKQKPLARMALDSLIELAPAHPRRADFESWVELMDEEVAQDARIGAALAAGREALAGGDFRRARRQVEALRKLDPDRADGFAAEVAAAEAEASEDAEAAEHRRAFETALTAGDATAAATQLAGLEGKVSRVTFDALASRLEELRRRDRREAAEAEAESRFTRRLEARDWSAARQVAMELSERFAESTAPHDMLQRLSDLERRDQRRSTVLDGERQIEALLGRGDADQAALALRVLLQLDPENPRRRKFERQIEELRG